MKPAPVPSDRTPLTREFGLPLYQQIHHLLRHRILTGEYPPGSKIPSENELCRELAVSRVTVREALRELVRRDMLVKVHGKGAFVADTPRRLQTVKYAGFLEDLQERVLKLTVTDVEMRSVAAPPDIAGKGTMHCNKDQRQSNVHPEILASGTCAYHSWVCGKL